MLHITQPMCCYKFFCWIYFFPNSSAPQIYNRTCWYGCIFPIISHIRTCWSCSSSCILYCSSSSSQWSHNKLSIFINLNIFKCCSNNLIRCYACHVCCSYSRTIVSTRCYFHLANSKFLWHNFKSNKDMNKVL